MKLDEQIDAIMDEFDFDRVKEMMTYCQWGWSTGEGDETEVPSGNDIRRTARRLLKRLVEEDCRINSTGGFTALKLNDALYLFWGVDSVDIEIE
jgi:hypothetical protein